MTLFRYLLVVIWIALLGFSVSCSRKNLRGRTIEQDFDLSPRIVTGQLDNGLTYYFLHNREPAERCFVRLNVAVGSFGEAENELGMAHFIEHLAFDDRSISGSMSLMEWFQAHGMAVGPDANAEVYPDHTVYKIDLPRCDEASVSDALKIFHSFAAAQSIREDAITKEKNIIDAEERELSDSQTQLTKKLIKHLYGNTFYDLRPVLGEAAIRSQFTKEMLTAFHEKWYAPANLTVVFVGDFGALNPEELIKANFSTLSPRKAAIQPVSPKPNHKTPYFAVHEDELAHVETIFSVQAKSITKPNLSKHVLKDKLAFTVALSILQEMYSLRFQKNSHLVREPAIEGAFVDNGVYELTLSIASLNHDVEEGFLEAFAVLKQAADVGFAEKSVNAAKTIMRDSLEQAVVSETTLSSDEWVDRIIEHANNDATALDATQFLMAAEPILATITAEDCRLALTKALNSGNHYLYALGAIVEGPETVTRLEQLMKRAQAQKTAAVTPEKEVVFRYISPVCQGNAPALTALTSVGGSLLRLDNGIEVILKPTNFKADEILIEINTEEGDGSMSKEELAVATLAKLTLFEGGLGQHGAEDIIRVLKDKYFSLSLALYSERLQASLVTRARDLQFGLELTKAFFMDPAYNEKALQRVKEQVAILYREREHQLWSPLEDEFLKTITHHDHRMGLMPLDDLKQIEGDALRAWHKRFLTDQLLRIVVVGDFKEDEMAKTVACMFGDLPARAKRKVTVAPLAFSSGVQVTYRVVAKDEAALVRLRYPLNFTGKTYPDHQLQILQAVINDVAREKLREKQQATYSPIVTVAENKNWAIQNWLDITFYAKVEQAVGLAHYLKLAIAKLAEKGIAKSKLIQAREPYLAQAKRALNESSFWASLLANNFAEAKDLTWMSKLDAEVNAIQPKEINQLLRKYFRVNNVSSAIVYPVKQ